MPSDPSGVSPKGVLTRPAPDFFDDNMGIGAWSYLTTLPTTFTYVAVSLFNNDNQGRVLKVYGITAEADGGAGMQASWFKGSFGTLVGPCSSIRPDLGAPPGLIYKDVLIVPAEFSPNTMPLNPAVGIIGISGFDSNTVLSPFPIFIIPVGWSLVLVNLETSSQGGAGFWYLVANE